MGIRAGLIAGSTDKGSLGLFDIGSLGEAGFGVAERRYEPAEVIFMQGDPTDRLYLLLDGMVRLYKTYSAYSEATVELLKDRGGFGEFDLFGQASQGSSAEAMSDCRVATVRKSDLRQAMERLPDLAPELFSLFSQKLRHSEQAMDVLVHRRVDSRLATLLPVLAKRFATDPGSESEAVIPLSHSQIAGMIASTREAVSKALKDLEEEELISLGKRKVLIKDQLRLEHRASAHT